MASRGLSLRARLGLSVALVVASVVGVATLLENRIVVGVVETEAMDAAAATALGIAGELGERPTSPSEADLDAMLFDFTRAEPALKSLTVTRVGEGEGPAVVTTDDAPSPEAVAQAGQALRERRLVSSGLGSSPLHFVAIPLEREHRPWGALVVAVSLEPALRVRRQTERTAVVFAVVAILALVLALDHLARRLVLRPLGAIRAVMVRASAGDLEARVVPARRDEIGGGGFRSQPHAGPALRLQHRPAPGGREGHPRAAGDQPAPRRHRAAPLRGPARPRPQRAARRRGPDGRRGGASDRHSPEPRLRVRPDAPGRAAQGLSGGGEAAHGERADRQGHDHRAGALGPGAPPPPRSAPHPAGGAARGRGRAGPTHLEGGPGGARSRDSLGASPRSSWTRARSSRRS